MNLNWTEKQDGWHKNKTSSSKGFSPFDKPIPPMRDSANRPLRQDDNTKIDWKKWDQELNGKEADQ